MSRKISAQELIMMSGSRRWPLVIDVRREAAYRASGRRIAGAIRRDHMAVSQWLPDLPAGRPIVVYCAQGHNVSQIAAAELAARGVAALLLDGGMEAYLDAGGSCVAIDVPDIQLADQPTVWVSRERPKIDRIACPWLVRRFIDPLAVFHFVAAEWVRDVAAEIGAVAYDVEGVRYSHRGERCTFDTLVEEFGLADSALDHLARIVRAADTARLELEPQAAGLLAISLGLSATETDDLEQLEKGMTIYDALYGWCRHATQETHNWPVGRSQ